MTDIFDVCNAKTASGLRLDISRDVDFGSLSTVDVDIGEHASLSDLIIKTQAAHCPGLRLSKTCPG